MAPVPEDNQDKPSNGNNSDESLSNPNVMMPIDVTETSDDSGSEEDDGHNGYALLPQDPFDCQDDSDSETNEREINDYLHSAMHEEAIAIPNVSGLDIVPEAVLSSEAGSSGPTADVSQTNNHPAFLAKFPGGKIPAYMQVPNIPRDKDDLLWNHCRQDSTKVPLDSANEGKILKAMSGFCLPSENVPDWAKAIPDEQWKKQLMGRLKQSEQQDDKIEGDKKNEDNSHEQWTANFDDNH